MSPRDWRDRVRDILEAMFEIQNFTQGMDYETFRQDPKSIRAVEMNFIIIGRQQTKSRKRLKKDIQQFLGT